MIICGHSVKVKIPTCQQPSRDSPYDRTIFYCTPQLCPFIWSADRRAKQLAPALGNQESSIADGDQVQYACSRYPISDVTLRNTRDS